MERVERAFVHVDYELRDGPEHKHERAMVAKLDREHLVQVQEVEEAKKRAEVKKTQLEEVREKALRQTLGQSNRSLGRGDSEGGGGG